MDPYEEYFEEVSDQEEEVGVVPPVVAVAPLNVEVPEIPDNPESPSPEPSPAASPAASPPGSPGPGDLPSFMGFFTIDDVTELEQWAVDAQSLRGTPDLRLEEPEILVNFKTFLQYTWGPHWSHQLVAEHGSFKKKQR